MEVDLDLPEQETRDGDDVGHPSAADGESVFGCEPCGRSKVVHVFEGV